MRGRGWPRRFLRWRHARTALQLPLFVLALAMIAHGLLGLSISSGLGTRAMARPFATLAFLGLRWRFKGPIKIGDTIKVRVKVTDKRETSKPDRGIVVLSRAVTNQRGEVVQEGETDIMVERRR